MLARPLSALVLLALAGTAPAQNWIQSIEENAIVDDMATRSDGSHVLLTSPVGSHARLELFNVTGDAQAAITVSSSSGSSLVVNALALRPDDTLLLAGSQDAHAWIGALDLGTGVMAWEVQTLAQPMAGAFYSVVQGAGQVFAGGYMYTQGVDPEGYVAAYSDQGAVQWQRRIGPLGGPVYVTELSPTGDGGVLGVVLVENPAGSQTHLVRYDSSGTLLWSRESDMTGGGLMLITPLSDGTHLLTRSAGVAGTWTAKITDGGSIAWQHTFGGAAPRDCTATANGGAALFTKISGFPGLLRIDSDGNGLWHKKLVEGIVFSGSGVVSANPDGSVMAAWSTLDFPNTNYLGRFDNAGTTSAGCGSSLFNLGITQSASSYGFTASALPTSIWFGAVGGLSTSTGTAVLDAQLFCGDPCGTPSSFCETTANSVGNGARINSNGGTSVSSNNLTLMTTGIPPNKSGIYFYGSTPTLLPFGQGKLCVGGQKFRLPLQTANATGTLTFDLDLTHPNASRITPGTTWYFQCWYRDFQGGGNGANLSDGLSTSWCP